MRAGNSTICYRKKRIDVNFSGVCPVIDNEFRQHCKTSLRIHSAIASWIHLTNWRQFFMRLSCYWSWISSSHCQSSCGSTRLSPRGSADYFDNVMTKFMINNRTDALKTDINLFFTITNCRIAGSRSLTCRMNFKFMCLSAYWQKKLANECAWISAVIVKLFIHTCDTGGIV